MSIKCCECGKFIPHADTENGTATFHFEPDNHFGSEVSEWTCRTCNGAPLVVNVQDELHQILGDALKASKVQ